MADLSRMVEEEERFHVFSISFEEGVPEYFQSITAFVIFFISRVAGKLKSLGLDEEIPEEWNRLSPPEGVRIYGASSYLRKKITESAKRADLC